MLKAVDRYYPLAGIGDVREVVEWDGGECMAGCTIALETLLLGVDGTWLIAKAGDAVGYRNSEPQVVTAAEIFGWLLRRADQSTDTKDDLVCSCGCADCDVERYLL